MRRTVHEVLARFDEAIGLDRVPRATVVRGAVAGSTAAPAAPLVTDDALAPWSAPRESLLAARRETEAAPVRERVVAVDCEQPASAWVGGHSCPGKKPASGSGVRKVNLASGAHNTGSRYERDRLSR
jgi:hypothetical protein